MKKRGGNDGESMVNGKLRGPPQCHPRNKTLLGAYFLGFPLGSHDYGEWMVEPLK